MECRTVREELVAFLDNEVSATLKTQIEAHLKECPDCVREMRALQASWQMLDRNLPPEPGADFTASVMSRVREAAPQRAERGGSEVPGPVYPAEAARQEPQSSGVLKPHWLERFLPSFMAVAVILVLLLISLVFWDHQRPVVKAPVAQLPEPSVESELQAPVKELQSLKPVADKSASEPKAAAPARVPVPQAIQTLPDIKPVVVPQPLPMVPVATGPVIAQVDKDRDIIANLDMYENAEMLKKMDVVSDMDVVASMKEKSS